MIILKSIFEFIAESINKRPYVVAGLIITVLLLGIYGATMTVMETGTKTYLNTDKPVGSLLIHYTDVFGSDTVVLIVEGEDVTSPDVLHYLDNLEKDLSDERYVTGATGLVDLIKLSNNGVIPRSRAEIDAVLDTLSPDYLEALLPSKMMTLISIPLEAGLSDASKEGIVSNVDSLIAFSSPPAGITVTPTGSPAFSVEMQEDMQSSMGTLIALALIFMVIAMCLLFGHVRYRLLPVFIVFCGIISTFGVMGFAGIPITSIVIAAFPVLIGIGVDYAIQFQSRFDEEINKSPMKEAVFATITSSGPAIFFAMLATALGFVALTFIAPSPMISGFGTTCIIGIVCCYISAMIVIPTFATIVKYKPKKGGSNPLDQAESCQLDWKGCDHDPEVKPGTKGSFMEKYDVAIGNLAGRIARNPVPVLVILLMVAVVGIQLDETIIIDTDEDAMVPQNMPAMISMNKLSSVIGSTNTITAFIRSDSILDPDTLRWVDDFGEYELSKQDDLTGVTSIATYLRLYNNGILPTEAAEIERVWNSIPESTRDNYVNGNLETVMQFSLRDISIPAAQELITYMQDDLEWYTPDAGMDVAYTGQMVMFGNLIDGIEETKNPMTIVGFVLILVLLLLLYRKFTAVTPLVPIIMIVGWNGIIMYSLGLTYSLLTACLGAMTIGVASEYTIVMMERYLEEKEKGLDTITAIQTSVQKIGAAVSVSGLATVCGFSALTLSTSPIIQNFGIVTVIAVGFSILGAIIVMPAAISVFESINDFIEDKKRHYAGGYQKNK
ncbi:efflux RND transporter permease subunit [Methanogenium organophilum]|uniref:Hydrophobe/amphiphile efflux-3 (HAE3) family transporter n=1 Tax=Methanogenium organophilum TaxID=2199 RepID=A0A9X9S415_METOG|nr:hydrophobe/amphiphile efflux-3 (HAE3) family transporter [Methanogenium organophilum]WAI01093.1 hydrophobe/amphiphile efflux-3 (HAE3) family transporter [Methanogenium organophilum]